jgi:hypothetical protein
VASRLADTPSKESYQLPIRYIVSELILNGKKLESDPTRKKKKNRRKELQNEEN